VSLPGDLQAAVDARCAACHARFGAAQRPSGAQRWDFLDHIVSSRNISGLPRKSKKMRGDNLRISWRRLCGATHSRFIFPAAAGGGGGGATAAFEGSGDVQFLLESRRNWRHAADMANTSVAELRRFCGFLDGANSTTQRQTSNRKSDRGGDDELYCFGDDAYMVRMESAAAKLRPTVAAATDGSGRVCGGLYTVTARVAEPGLYTASTALSFSRGTHLQRADADAPADVKPGAALPPDLFAALNRSSDAIQGRWFDAWLGNRDTRTKLFQIYATPNCALGLPPVKAAGGAEPWAGTPARPLVVASIDVSDIPESRGVVRRCSLDAIAPRASNRTSPTLAGRWVNLTHPTAQAAMARYAATHGVSRARQQHGTTPQVLCGLPYCAGDATLVESGGWVFAPYACHFVFPNADDAWAHLRDRKIVIIGDSTTSHTMFNLLRRVLRAAVPDSDAKNPFRAEAFEAVVQRRPKAPNPKLELFHYHTHLLSRAAGPFGLQFLRHRMKDNFLPWLVGAPALDRATPTFNYQPFPRRRPDVVLVASNTHDTLPRRQTVAGYGADVAGAVQQLQGKYVGDRGRRYPNASAMPVFFWRSNVVPGGAHFECSHKQGPYRSAAMDRAAHGSLSRAAAALPGAALRAALAFRWLDVAELTHAFQFDMAFTDGLHYGGFHAPSKRYQVDFMMAVAWWNAFDAALAGRPISKTV
jgi:hypothetical protein